MRSKSIRAGIFAVALLGTFAFAVPGARAQETVRIKVEMISMIDDSDDLSDCDCHFWANIHGGAKPLAVMLFNNGGRPISLGTDRVIETVYPGSVLENPAKQLTIFVSGLDIDVENWNLTAASIGKPAKPLSNSYADTNVAQGTIDLNSMAGEHFDKRITLRSVGGKLQFAAIVRIQITRAKPATSLEGRARTNVLTSPGEMPTIKSTPRVAKSIGKSFQGTWATTTNYGNFQMVLQRDGDRVKGTFAGNGSSGTIAGTVFDGKLLIFSWTQDNGKYKGSGKFMLSNDGRSFTGTYGNNLKDPDDGSAGAWNGRKL